MINVSKMSFPCALFLSEGGIPTALQLYTFRRQKNLRWNGGIGYCSKLVSLKLVIT